MPLPKLPHILALHDHATQLWHAEPCASPAYENDLERTVSAQHRANFDLWHIEDEARTPGLSDAALAHTKHAIDRVNQRRNDLAEACDALLLETLSPFGLPYGDAELHSESPGLMIDRLSILALKLYHTREELGRAGAPPGHLERNRERLRILEQQRADLALALDRFWTRVLRGERSFRVYRQLKMYNDPALNPSVYGAPAAGRGGGAI